MENKEIDKKLSSLAQLDIDAVNTYREAIDKVEVKQVRENLTRYREEHERHISELSFEIRRLGETSPEFSPDFKAFLIQGFTSLLSMTGTEGALKAMHTNEKLTNKTYKEAIIWNLSTGIQTIIDQAYEAERHHLEYIEMELNK